MTLQRVTTSRFLLRGTSHRTMHRKGPKHLMTSSVGRMWWLLCLVIPKARRSSLSSPPSGRVSTSAPASLLSRPILFTLLRSQSSRRPGTRITQPCHRFAPEPIHRRPRDNACQIKRLNFPPFVAKVNAYVDIGTALATSTISVDFDISNPLDTEIEIAFAQADSGLDGETYVHFEHALNNFAVPPHSTANSGAINNVRLTQGTLGLIELLGAKTVDVFTVATVKIGVYTVPWLHLTALDVPIHRNP